MKLDFLNKPVGKKAKSSSSGTTPAGSKPNPKTQPQPQSATSKQSAPAAPAQPSPQDQLSRGVTSVKDIIAPGALEIDFSFQKIANTYFRTLFVSGYPRFVNANWLAPLINFERSLDVAMYIYPIEGRGIMDDLRRKVGEM